MDPSLELMGHLHELNGSAMEIPDSGVVGFFSEDDYLSHQSELGMPFPDHVSGVLPAESQAPAAPPPQPDASVAERSLGDRKRKGMEAPVSNGQLASEAGLRLLEIKKKTSNVHAVLYLIVQLTVIFITSFP
ncbi:hypothetical protein B296_00053375 [Ensete ventricosum]|uniref:Uncharacterized protein n=1 Tax=Ensete ventricosum TaxID=4639 RepID=A0A426X6S1_ENSVE|nr:hypothetical protein B296_00053375 [Ensete ventricosum]